MLDFHNLSALFASLLSVKLVPALIVLIICLLVKKLVMRMVSKAIELSKIDITLKKFAMSIINVLLYILAAIIIADTLGISVTSLVAVLSVAGLAVSLAVQGTLSNLVGGVMLLVSKPFVVGDYIEAGSVSGTVNQVGLIYTDILTVDNKTIHIPNNEISAGKIINYTAMDKRRVEINISASYDDDIDKVKTAILKAAEKSTEILSDPPVFVNVSAYNDSSIEYVFRAWVPTGDYWNVHFRLLEDIKKQFDASGVSMSYPHMNVHVIENK